MNTPTPKIPRSLFAALVLLFLPPFAGCDPDDVFEPDDVTDRGGNGSTIKFNTSVLEGIDELDTVGEVWAGAHLKGIYLACSAVTGQEIPSACDTDPAFKLDAVWSEQGQLQGKSEGILFSVHEFLDSEWVLDMYQDGEVVSEQHLMIQAYHVTNDHHDYTFLIRSGADTWVPACVNNGPIWNEELGGRAVVLGDVSVDTVSGVLSERANTLYIACAGGAVGKAVAWGYNPWTIGVENLTTAVRMVRADYCGDGMSWTTYGTPIQLMDVWGFNPFIHSLARNESVWSTRGALCLSTRRVDPDGIMPPIKCHGEPLPACTDPYTYYGPAASELENTAQTTIHPEGTIWTKLPGAPFDPPPGNPWL